MNDPTESSLGITIRGVLGGPCAACCMDNKEDCEKAVEELETVLLHDIDIVVRNRARSLERLHELL